MHKQANISRGMPAVSYKIKVIDFSMLNMYSVITTDRQQYDLLQTTATECSASVAYKKKHHVLGLNLGPQTNYPD